MKTQTFEDVLRFWFPPSLEASLEPDQSVLAYQWLRWFRGGANPEIMQQFGPLLEQAIQGELDDWSHEPQSRLALIIVLDQFSRVVYQGTPEAFAQDDKACTLTLTGIEIEHYAALKTPWQKTFFLLPLGHSEDLNHLELVIRLVDDLVQEASPNNRAWLEFSAAQARRHREVIARFGRHPHRNEVLGRSSTPDELEYLATCKPVHQRSLPPHLSQFLTNTDS